MRIGLIPRDNNSILKRFANVVLPDDDGPAIQIRRILEISPSIISPSSDNILL